MPSQTIPPPRRSGSKRSDPSEHLRVATSTWLSRSLEVPSFKDPEMKKYCKSLRQHHDFEKALEDHKQELETSVMSLPETQVTSSSATQVKPSPYERPWTHKTLVKWIDRDDHQQGVEVSLHSKNGTQTFITEFTYERPPTDVLEEHMVFDYGTNLLTEAYPNEWEEATGTLVSELYRHGIEEPFTGTSTIKGRVRFMNKDRTSLNDPLSVEIGFMKDKRDPLRFQFYHGIFSELDQSPQN